jgi:predicted ATPase/signal transduction histidine kinase
MQIAGYAVRSLFQTTTNNLLFRATREADGEPVILKTPRAEHPGPRERARYQREFHLLQRLRGTPGVPATHGLELLQERPVLLLEDVGGTALSEHTGQALSAERLLALALPLTATLAEVHRRGVIHKDIKPANILLSEGGRVWLIDFGMATSRQLEHVDAIPSGLVEGTLAYMSPEQSGRMNRAVDYRTDLYSLGVVFYQLLTGQLPFRGRDALEWFHAHIAQEPLPPAERQPGVPLALSALVLRLLGKNAEQRYQSAEGLLEDLARCQEGLRRGALEPFTLGERDFPARFQPPQHLYGRGPELRALLDAFERVAREARPEWVLVSGYSGIGKSSLVHELHKPILQRRGIFLSGKFNALQREVPYATLAHALRGLVRQMLAGSEQEVAHWRERLLEAFEGEGQVLVGLVPQLAQVVGPLPAARELPLAEARHRFHRLFQRFLGVVAAPERPVVVFLDDLQWADFASLELLHALSTHPDTPPLLLLGAYRDNEVSASHPLALTLTRVRQDGGRLVELHLGALAPPWTEELVADALPGAADDVVRPLAALAQEKTAGNPFFLLQFLQTLYQEGLVARAAPGGWHWQEEAVRARGYSDNVVDFMAGRLRQQPASAQRLLRLAACVGQAFALETLALLSRLEEPEVERGLEPVLAEGLLVETAPQHYRFPHDRILQASLALMSESEREATHLEIGRMLWARLSPEALRERLFDVVGQLNAGARGMRDADERERLARLNAEAGARARDSTAYRSAVGYFAMAFSLLPGDPWLTAPERAFALRLEQARCELVSGNAPEALRLVDELPPRAPTRQDLAAAYQLKSGVLLTLNQADAAARCLLECLARFGVELPLRPTWEDVVAANQEVEALLGERPIDSLLELPVMTDPDMKSALELLAALTWPAFFSNDLLLALHLCRMVALTLRHGNSPAAASGYAWYGSVLASHFKRYPRGDAFGQLAYAFIERHPGRAAYRGRTLFTVANVGVWVRPMPLAMEFYQRAFQESVQSGDFQIACFSCLFISLVHMHEGQALGELSHELATQTDFARKVGFRQPEDMLRISHAFVHQLRGLTDTFGSLEREGFNEREFEAQLPGRLPTLRFWYGTQKGRALFLRGAHEEARPFLEQAKATRGFNSGRLQLFDYHVYRALNLAACHRGAPEPRREEDLREIEAHHQQLAEWALHCPETFLASERLVAAELERLRGQTEAAPRLYEEALQSAREQKHVHLAALACELASLFWRERRLPTVALTYGRQAREAYAQWGADGKVRDLDTQWPALSGRVLDGDDSASHDSDSTHLDAVTLVKAQQAISSEIHLDTLVSTLLRVALENAGAQRGALLRLRGEELTVEAVSGSPGTPSHALPWSLLSYVRRASEQVLIDDTSLPHPFASDPFFTGRPPGSLLCLPLLRKERLHGVLYLENALTPQAFRPGRITLLQHLATQAAISLENARLYGDVQQAESALRQANEQLERRVEERTRELKQAQASLVETARMVGMAEVAANVLHDVGNTLTSLVVDTEQLHALVAGSRVDRVAKVSALLDAHRDRLPDFLLHDARGRQVLTYLSGLSTELVQEQDALRQGLRAMSRNVERVRTIIHLQQDYPKATLLEEECDLAEVVDEALRLQSGALRQAGVRVTRDLASVPRVKVDRHRLLQILLNLLSNARQAMESVDVARRELRLRLEDDTRGGLRLRVTDSGQGIAPEVRGRLFTQGFTTRAGGHGIGLHASALSARLMGGELTLDSEGPGLGATATLVLPAIRAPG